MKRKIQNVGLQNVSGLSLRQRMAAQRMGTSSVGIPQPRYERPEAWETELGSNDKGFEAGFVNFSRSADLDPVRRQTTDVFMGVLPPPPQGTVITFYPNNYDMLSFTPTVDEEPEIADDGEIYVPTTPRPEDQVFPEDNPNLQRVSFKKPRKTGAGQKFDPTRMVVFGNKYGDEWVPENLEFRYNKDQKQAKSSKWSVWIEYEEENGELNFKRLDRGTLPSLVSKYAPEAPPTKNIMLDLQRQLTDEYEDAYIEPPSIHFMEAANPLDKYKTYTGDVFVPQDYRLGYVPDFNLPLAHTVGVNNPQLQSMAMANLERRGVVPFQTANPLQGVGL